MTRPQIDLMAAAAFILAVGIGCNGLPVIQTQQPTPPPAATPAAQAPTPDADKAELLDKLNELEKKLDQQKQVKTAPPVIKGSGTTAWVNSPGDGFLALRSNPSSDVGYRILQIPHGASVRVLGCQNFSQRVAGRSGRWCNVSYGGSTGWAFDGWLVY